MALPANVKQAVFKELGGSLVIEEVPLQLPKAGEILVKVEACGVCHSEVLAQYDAWGFGFPVVPGHEIIGRVAALGDGVTGWQIGDRIGGGWHGGHDNTCATCHKKLYQFCQPVIINGISKNGGYAEYCLLRAEATVRIPEDADAAKYAPLLCAGTTAFSALKSVDIEEGDLVAIQGLGGVGHLGVQYAKKLGTRVVAISRGAEKEESIKALGADEYIDASGGQDPGEMLKEMGYAKVVLTTAMETAAMPPLIKGIGVRGKLIILSLPQDGHVTVDSNDMITRGVSVQSWPVGNCFDAQEAMTFAHKNDVKCSIQTFPLEKAQQAYDAMLNGTVRYRAVLTMDWA
ncbi:alcohol dehydrogenase GroES-like domain-containing protein [Xylariomycetidae sp. FL2044]|nr:alcohol dehydrogenase GroES-like domain-containing protein [Xylariomycetidae sp. FL2044]